MSIAPDGAPRRSPVYRQLARAGARFVRLDDAVVADDFGAPERERAIVAQMGLADLSPLPRCGFKGHGALAWLRGRGLAIGEDDDRAWRQDDGSLVARLAASEAVVLDSLARPGTSSRLIAAWSYAAVGCHPVPRRDGHAWFAATGAHVGDMFAKLCAVDLRLHRFPPGGAAQTVAARLPVVVIRAPDAVDVPVYDVLADSASAPYLWDALTDAMAEFGGAPVGLTTLRAVSTP